MFNDSFTVTDLGNGYVQITIKASDNKVEVFKIAKADYLIAVANFK